MPRLRHGATPNIAEIEATLAILSDTQQSPVVNQLVEAITVQAQTESAQPVATLNLVEALNLQRFAFMLPNDDANLLPVTPQTAEFLTKLGRSMLDPGPAAADNPGDSNIPAAYTYFGQFIDHDVTLETSSAGADELLVPGLKPFDPEIIALLIANIRTGALDLDSVYGNPQRKDPGDPNKLRVGTVTSCAPFCGVRPTHPDGVTERDDFNDVDREPPHPIPSHDRAALTGDPRNDENLIVSQLHLAFLRAHNALVDSQNLSFDEARASLRRHYQFLVIHDFLKRVADPAIVDDILQNGSPTLTNGELLYPPATKGNTDEFFMPLEYAVAAYRFGHSMVRARYNFNVNFPTATLDLLFTFTALSGQIGGGGIPEFPTVPENWIIQWEGLIDESTGDKTRRIDTKLVDPLFELKNLKGEVLAPADVARLAVRNLLRGYLLRIPTGQAAATAMGITPLTPAQIKAAAASTAQQQVLEDAGFLTKTPLWFYILAEASAATAIGGGNGNRLGAVGSTIVASVLIGAARRSADSFLDEGVFPPGSEFEPTMPMSGATFKLADLLTFAGVFDTTTAVACRYTVVAGDTLSGIAQRVYGDPAQWPRIFQANQDQLSDPDVISPGQVLRIPATGQHTVVSGDSLSGIAQQFYGDVSLWPRIFAVNRDQISNPNIISPGQVLCIP